MSVKGTLKKLLPRAALEWRAARWRERQARRVLSEKRLAQLGYWRSVREARPVDRDGAPLPWLTYSAIAYLDSLDTARWSVLEWGGGHSTLYWAERAASVFTIEHDPKWAAELQRRAAQHAHVRIRAAEDPDTYLSVDATARYDLIVIDGVWRRACAQLAAAHLKPTGAIVLDNSDWFPETAAHLRNEYLQIDFAGLSPSSWTASVTSLFVGPGYRPAPRAEQPRPPPGGDPLTWDDDPLHGWPPPKS